MDKFLQLCFKIGKWALSGVLVLLFITGICLGGFVLTKTMAVDSYKLDYKLDVDTLPFSDNVVSGNNNKNTTTTANKKDNNAKYAEAIKKSLEGIKDAQVSDKQLNTMASYVAKKVEERDTKDFIKNFPPFYTTLFEAAVKKMMNTYQNADEGKVRNYLRTEADALSSAFEGYCEQYEKQVRLRELDNIKIKASRTVGIYAFLVTLAVFIAVLIIPILIKIEENTRK